MILLNTRNSFVLLTAEEKEHIVSEFIRNKMYKDLAMFISTTESVNFTDLFIYDNFLDISVYRLISQEIFNYFKVLIDKDNPSEAIKIIYKMYFNTYINTYRNKYNINMNISDFIQSELIDSMLNYLVQLRLDETLHIILGDIDSNINIPGYQIIIDFIFNEELNIDYKTIEYCFYNEFIGHEDLIDNFYYLIERYDEEYLTELLYRIFDNREELLGYAQLLYKRYSVNYIKNGYDLSYLDCYSLNQYKGFDFIKKIVQDKLLVDMEMDFYYEFISNGLNMFTETNDLRRIKIYESLSKWYVDILESHKIKSIFFQQNYVDKDESFPIEDEDILLMVSDLNTMGYLLKLEDLALYDQIIRLINISRFEFFKVRRKSGIERLISKTINDYNRDTIENFIKTDFLSFILYL